MRKILVLSAPLGVLLLGVAIVLGLHATKPKPDKADEPSIRPAALIVEPVRREPAVLTVETQGEVEALTEIDLVTQVSGRVVSVAPNFVAGGNAGAGETLVEIEPDDYRFAIKQAEARVAEARLAAAEEEARAEVARRQWAWEGVEGKPTPLALKEPHVAQARARLAAAEAELENARLNLARTRISVPFDGRVREKSADIGQFVGAGTRLGRVFSTERVQVRLPLTDTQLAEVDLPLAFATDDPEAGRPVTLTANLAGRTRQWHGRIVRTDAAVDRQTRLFYAIAEVEEPYGAGSDDGVPLPVGLFVSARIEGKLVRDAFIVPRSALRGEKEVYVVTDDNLLSIRSVDVVSADRDRVILASGVSEGERVVVSPVRVARDGMPVEPLKRDETAQLAQAVD